GTKAGNLLPQTVSEGKRRFQFPCQGRPHRGYFRTHPRGCRKRGRLRIDGSAAHYSGSPVAHSAAGRYIFRAEPAISPINREDYMPNRLLTQAARLTLILAGLTASGRTQTSQIVHVEFNMFAGRARPKAEIADAGKAQAILDSLAIRTAEASPCSEIPAMPSSPGYTATLLQF